MTPPVRDSLLHVVCTLTRRNSIRDTVQGQHKHIPNQSDAHHSRDSEPQSSPCFVLTFKLLGVHGFRFNKVCCRNLERGDTRGRMGFEATELRLKCRRARAVPTLSNRVLSYPQVCVRVGAAPAAVTRITAHSTHYCFCCDCAPFSSAVRFLPDWAADQAALFFTYSR
jgi:hypothetical protein